MGSVEEVFANCSVDRQDVDVDCADSVTLTVECSVS